MNLYTSSPSNAVVNETNNPPSSFISSFHNWQQPVPAQGDFNLPMVHAPSQNVTPTVPQDYIAQSNAPSFPQPLIHAYQQQCGQFSVQGDTGPEVNFLPQHLASAAASQRQVAQPNASLPPQPTHPVWQGTFPVQGDPGTLHVPSKTVSPIQTITPTDQKRHTCPYCKRKFKRKQELKRHLLSNLPDSILCPFPLCPWTGHRQYSLMKHMKVHPSPRERERKEFQIYDLEKLVRSMANGTLTVECAADIALSKIKERFQEQDKVGVEANVWGSRRKFCTARSYS